MSNCLVIYYGVFYEMIGKIRIGGRARCSLGLRVVFLLQLWLMCGIFFLPP